MTENEMHNVTAGLSNLPFNLAMGLIPSGVVTVHFVGCAVRWLFLRR